MRENVTPQQSFFGAAYLTGFATLQRDVQTSPRRLGLASADRPGVSVLAVVPN